MNRFSKEDRQVFLGACKQVYDILLTVGKACKAQTFPWKKGLYILYNCLYSKTYFSLAVSKAFEKPIRVRPAPRFVF